MLELTPEKETDNEKVFTPIEEAFNKAYRRFRINSDSKVDVETFFNKIRSKLIDLIGNQLDEMNSAKIQFILWLKFRKQEGDEEIQVDKAFNSKITEFFQASDFNELIEEMFSRIKTQVENPALPASGFSLDQVLHLHIDFHKLNLTRGSSYIPLPDWISKKKAVINPKNEDQECFKWAVTVALNHGEISEKSRKNIEYQTLHQ